jgi:Mn-dependent DtxR family transcriptional regulator
VKQTIQEQIQELSNVNRLLLEKLDDAEPSPTTGAILKAIGQILSNHQSGDRLTYSGLSKELHRGKPFVKKVLKRMIEEGLARYDDNKRSIFLL